MENKISKDLKRSTRLHKNVSCMQYTNKSVSRSAASWVAWRAHQLTVSLIQVPKINRVLGVMAGSSILDRTWSYLRVEVIDWRQRGTTSDSGTNQLTVSLIQVPCEHIAGTLSSKSAGYVSEHTALSGPSRTHCGAHGDEVGQRSTETTPGTNTRRLSCAKRNFRRRSRQYPREWTVSFAR